MSTTHPPVEVTPNPDPREGSGSSVGNTDPTTIPGAAAELVGSAVLGEASQPNSTDTPIAAETDAPSTTTAHEDFRGTTLVQPVETTDGTMPKPRKGKWVMIGGLVAAAAVAVPALFGAIKVGAETDGTDQGTSVSDTQTGEPTPSVEDLPPNWAERLAQTKVEDTKYAEYNAMTDQEFIDSFAIHGADVRDTNGLIQVFEQRTTIMSNTGGTVRKDQVVGADGIYTQAARAAGAGADARRQMFGDMIVDRYGALIDQFVTGADLQQHYRNGMQQLAVSHAAAFIENEDNTSDYMYTTDVLSASTQTMNDIRITATPTTPNSSLENPQEGQMVTLSWQRTLTSDAILWEDSIDRSKDLVWTYDIKSATFVYENGNWMLKAIDGDQTSGITATP